MRLEKDTGIRPEREEVMSERASGSIPYSLFPNPSATTDSALERAVTWLLDNQATAGYWSGELEGDTILESEYIILMRFLNRGDEVKLCKAAAYLREKQMDNGGWPTYPNGPVDASASVEAYFALKLTGARPDEPHMVKAREAIRSVGGVPVSNSYTKFYLAMLGQIPWEDAPAVPPELNLLPKWFYFNIYEISSWSRTFVVPLSIIWASKPVTQVPDEQGIDELLADGDRERVRLRANSPVLSWRNFFIAADSLFKAAEKLRLLPLRKRAVSRAKRWMLEHCEHSAGFGAIFPPMVYALIALRVLGYSDDSREVRMASDELAALEIEEEDTLRLEPCTSPVWDTAIAVNALSEAGIAADSTALLDAARWIVSKEVTLRGDWSVKRPNLEPGGWYFEFLNEFYPDIDDTAMVLMALTKCADVPGKQDSMRRGINWLLGMQGSDGGWASFDVDNNRAVFNNIPFADHNAMLDPSTSDITARILEMLSFFDVGHDDPHVRRAIEFMRREQEPDGSWFGRWGVNYIYGTWQAIRGLTRIGIDPADPMIVRAAQWLASVQNEDGGWGESCASYEDPRLSGEGPSTASQTAWALMGLMCANETNSDAVRRGFDYLVRTQRYDGTWDEEPFTGTGFPKVFYINYHLYRQSFPTMALGMLRRKNSR
jgi:squalene-hopene/tetraprenyl-beta-curcumene cyclase